MTCERVKLCKGAKVLVSETARVLVSSIMEEDGEDQEDEQDDRREEGQQEVERRESQRVRTTTS